MQSIGLVVCTLLKIVEQEGTSDGIERIASRFNFSETNEKKYFGIRASFDDPWISFLLLKITIFTYVIQSRCMKNYNGEVKTKSLNPFSSYSSM